MSFVSFDRFDVPVALKAAEIAVNLATKEDFLYETFGAVPESSIKSQLTC